MPQALIGSLRIDLGLKTAAFEKGLSSMQKRLKRAQRDIERAGKKMQKAGRSLSVGLTAPIAAFGVAIARAAGNFEAGMNRVAAVSGASATELARLRDLAKEMGATTQFSASQAADAMGFLAQAGFDTNEIMSALPGTLQLAAAAQMDLGRAADIVSNVLSGYGLEVSELSRANDVLVKTFTSTNTNLEQLGEAMKYAGPVASAAGVQFEEAAAALGLMGNAGIQASMAGTSLRGAIAKIFDPSKDAAASMKRLGLNFLDGEGRLISFDKIIQQLEPHVEDAALFLELFGQRAGPGMASLVAQGSGALRDLTGELENAGGTAERISKAQMQGFNGAMLRLKSAFEALMIAIADSGLLDALTSFASKIAETLTQLSKTNPELLRTITIVAAVVAAIGPLLAILGTLVVSIAAVLSPIGLMVTALIGGLGLIVAYGQWKDSINEVIVAQRELDKALKESKAARETDIGLTAESIKAQLKSAASIRKTIKAQLELNRIRAAGKLREMDAASGGLFGLGGVVEGAEYQQLQNMVAAAEKEMAAQDKHIMDLSNELVRVAMPGTGVSPSGSLPAPSALSTSPAATIKTETQDTTDLAIARERAVDALLAEQDAQSRADADKQRNMATKMDAHVTSTRATIDETRANLELAAAYRVSAEEGRIVAEVQAIQARGTQLSTEKVRELAVAQIESVDALAQARAAANKTGDAMHNAFKRGADAFSGLINAIKSGDIGGILQQGIGFLSQLFGKGGSSGGGIGGALSKFAGLFDNGGRIPAGQWGIAGERGPEFIRGPASVTSRLATAGMMRGPTSGGSAMPPIRLIVEEGPMFRTVVQGEAVEVSNTLAPMHAQGAVAQAQRNQSMKYGQRL